MNLLLRKKNRFWVIALFWLLVAVLLATKSALGIKHKFGAAQWIQNFFYQGSGALVWALLTPLVIRFVKRFDFTKGAWGKTFLIHLALSIPIALTHRAFAITVDFGVRDLVGMGFFETWNPFSIIYTFRFVILESAITSLLTYWILVTTLTALAYYIREKANQPTTNYKEDKRLRNHLKVKFEGEYKLIPIDNVISCEASGNYITLNTQDGQYRIRETMNELEKKLGFPFIRVHRSSIVNIQYLESFQHLYQGEYLLKFSNGQQLTSTRAYRENLLPVLSKA